MTDTFMPTGNTVIVQATVAGSSVQVTNNTQASQYLLQNLSNSDTIWIAMGFGSAPTCTIPVAGTPGTAFPLQHDAPVLIVSSWPNAYFTVKVGSGTHDLAITPGESLR